MSAELIDRQCLLDYLGLSDEQLEVLGCKIDLILNSAVSFLEAELCMKLCPEIVTTYHDLSDGCIQLCHECDFPNYGELENPNGTWIKGLDGEVIPLDQFKRVGRSMCFCPCPPCDCPCSCKQYEVRCMVGTSEVDDCLKVVLFNMAGRLIISDILQRECVSTDTTGTADSVVEKCSISVGKVSKSYEKSSGSSSSTSCCTKYACQKAFEASLGWEKSCIDRNKNCFSFFV